MTARGGSSTTALHFEQDCEFSFLPWGSQFEYSGVPPRVHWCKGTKSPAKNTIQRRFFKKKKKKRRQTTHCQQKKIAYMTNLEVVT